VWVLGVVEAPKRSAQPDLVDDNDTLAGLASGGVKAPDVVAAIAEVKAGPTACPK
jgi:hypothetical protein